MKIELCLSCFLVVVTKYPTKQLERKKVSLLIVLDGSPQVDVALWAQAEQAWVGQSVEECDLYSWVDKETEIKAGSIQG